VLVVGEAAESLRRNQRTTMGDRQCSAWKCALRDAFAKDGESARKSLFLPFEGSAQGCDLWPGLLQKSSAVTSCERPL
jgi:hypothetical protein